MINIFLLQIQTYLLSSVEFFLLSNENDDLGLLYLVLNSVSHSPMYTFDSCFDVTSALYTMFLVRQFPDRGQFSGFLQLHLSAAGVVFCRIFLLCASMIRSMLSIQL